MAVERLQAPSGGLNTDASPDYVGAMQAPFLQNLLPGRAGKVAMRGSLTAGLNVQSTSNPATAFWSFDDLALLKTNSKVWYLTNTFATKTDVTATVVLDPANSRHVRYGNYVYGTVVDGFGVRQMARWDGTASALVQQTNGPSNFVDLQVYAQRVFALSGVPPGGGAAVSSRVLYWTDPDPAADLSLLASWRDDTVTVPVINQLAYDAEDAPIALATCGKYLAILGSRSVSILTGSGSSSFAVRSLTRNLGCTDIESVVEVDDGFFFQSDRGLCFCDGSTITQVSDDVRSDIVGSATNWSAVFGHGFLALAQAARTWLFHISSKTWTQVTSACFPSTLPLSVHRSLTYPLIWDGKNIWVANNITTWSSGGGNDSGAGLSAAAIPARLKTRVARLSSPTTVATVQRVIVDSTLGNSAGTWSVTVCDGHDVTLDTGAAAGQASGVSRNRAQFDAFAETSTAYLDVAYAPTGTPTLTVAEIYDCWLEFASGRNEPGF